MQNDIVTLLSLVPAAIFAAATFLYFADLQDFQRLLADWGYAPRSHVPIGGLTVVATAALAVPEIRVWGVANEKEQRGHGQEGYRRDRGATGPCGVPWTRTDGGGSASGTCPAEALFHVKHEPSLHGLTAGA